MTVSVVDANFPPVISVPEIDSIAATREDAATGSIAVGSLTATDDDGHGFQWFLDGDSSSSAFAVQASNGRITVRDSTLIDFETAPTTGAASTRYISIRVLARDDGPGELEGRATILIPIEDAPEPPRLPASFAFVIARPENITAGVAASHETFLGKVPFSDDDVGDAVTLRLEAATMADLAIAPAGWNPALGTGHLAVVASSANYSSSLLRLKIDGSTG